MTLRAAILGAAAALVSSCSLPQSQCARLPAVLDAPEAFAGCGPTTIKIPLENTCHAPLRVTRVEVSPSSLGVATPSLELTLSAGDGGVAEGAMSFFFEDGSSRQLPFSASRPVRPPLRVDFQPQPVVDVIIVFGQGLQPAAFRDKFDSFLPSAALWRFYRLHFVTSEAGATQLVSGPSGQRFLDSRDPDFIARFDSFLAQVVPVPNVWGALPSAASLAALQPGTELEVVVFGTGAEPLPEETETWLRTPLHNLRRLAGVRLFTAPQSCPTSLSPSAASSGVVWLDLCFAAHELELKSLVRSSFAYPLAIYLPEAFVPSLRVLADERQIDDWSVEATTLGPEVRVAPEALIGRSVLSFRAEARTPCE